MKKCIIIIPIYKEKPNHSEQASFKQVLSVLYNYQITLVTHKCLDLKIYNKLSQQTNKPFKIEYFDKYYFNSIKGYNNLCVSKYFYRCFLEYEYMLIYQLDAWVFKDELDYWCNKNYDYIGAPWFTNWGSYNENEKLWEVGNGGFCLRKISFFYKLLSYKWSLSYNIVFNKGIKSFIKSILYSIGYHNTIQWHIKQNTYLNEDYFFSIILNQQITKHKKFQLKKPNVEEAMHFAFEKSPSYLYELCDKRLPFGCHAYKRYEFENFWLKHIKE